MANNLLIESMSWIPHIFEGADKLTRLRFKFMEAEKVNVNKRRYPTNVLSGAIGAAQKKIDQGGAIYGSLGHLGQLEVSDISHRILHLEMNGNDAVAEAQVLATSKGKDLLAVISAGGAVGVSARGTGNVVNKNGIDVVQSDYCLHGIDAVINPSFDAHVSQANIFECASFDGVEKSADSRTLFEQYREAQAAGWKGSLDEFEQRPDLTKDMDRKLLREWREARLAGNPLSYRDFWIAYLEKHGGEE